MMTVNLVTPIRLGPVFDPEARGFGRIIPRRPWWPILPVLVVGAPVLLVARLSELRHD